MSLVRRRGVEALATALGMGALPAACPTTDAGVGSGAMRSSAAASLLLCGCFAPAAALALFEFVALRAYGRELCCSSSA